MSFLTWNPIHSQQVREILAHATDEERRRFSRLSMIGGLVLGVSAMAAFMPVVGVAASAEMRVSMRTLWMVAIASVPMAFFGGIVTVVIMRRAVRNMLVSFEWAKEQGITKESLKLDRWG